MSCRVRGKLEYVAKLAIAMEDVSAPRGAPPSLVYSVSLYARLGKERVLIYLNDSVYVVVPGKRMYLRRRNSS